MVSSQFIFIYGEAAADDKKTCLPDSVLQKLHPPELDIRQAGTQDMVENNLSVVRNYLAEHGNTSVICHYSNTENMSNLEIKHANEILILQYLQKGFFSITTKELIQIQNTDPGISRMVKEDKEGNYERHNGVVFHRNMVDGTQRMCLVLPEYIARLVLKELHTVKMMHLSAKQMARLFMFTFFTKNITRHCQEIAQMCLHCVCNFLRRNNVARLGERKLLPTLLPNQIWVIDTLAMPQSFGYTYLAVMVDEASGYVILMPMKSCTMKEVTRVLYQHLCSFLAFSILKSDFGSKYNSQVTQFLSRFDITHYSSISRRS